MKRADAKREIRALMHIWRAGECPEMPKDQLRASTFISWLQAHSPDHLHFASPVTGVQYDIDMWFESEFRSRR